MESCTLAVGYAQLRSQQGVLPEENKQTCDTPFHFNETCNQGWGPLMMSWDVTTSFTQSLMLMFLGDVFLDPDPPKMILFQLS